MTWGSLEKPSATERKKAKLKTRRDAKAKEDSAKQAVRRREHFRCRFPLCGCEKLKLRLEVSHDRHKGAGGNPAGDRSTTGGMVLLCEHRHQHGAISRHAGTLRTRYLTDLGSDGPLAWDIDAAVLTKHKVPHSSGNFFVDPADGYRLWVTVAFEGRPHEYVYKDRPLLERLAEMDL